MKAMPQRSRRARTDFYTIENSVRTSRRQRGEAGPSVREPGSRLVDLGGSLPVGAQPRHLTIAIEEPARICRRVAPRLLEARGVQIHGATRARHSGDRRLRARMVQRRPSWPGARRTACRRDRHVNKNSLNLHAELLLLLRA